MPPFAPCYIAPEFIGVDPTMLQAWLTACQQAMQDLTIGGKAEVLSYAQGDGSKSVTYTRANLGYLENRTRALARALGLIGPRRAITPSF